MHKEIDINIIDSLTLKHTVIANFGFLLANTIDKNFNSKLDINMRNLTSYLIESETIDANELKDIIKLQSNFGLKNYYHFTKIYKGDETTEPTLLFQISNIVMNLDKLFFKKVHNSYSILRNLTWYRKKVCNKPILEIYTSYFNIVKLNSHFNDNIKHYRDINILQEKLIEAIDFHYHPSEKEIFKYDANEKDIHLITLEERKISLLNEICSFVHILHTSFEEETLNKLTNLLYTELKAYKDINSNISLSMYLEIFKKYLNTQTNSSIDKLK